MTTWQAECFCWTPAFLAALWCSWLVQNVSCVMATVSVLRMDWLVLAWAIFARIINQSSVFSFTLKQRAAKSAAFNCMCFVPAALSVFVRKMKKMFVVYLSKEEDVYACLMHTSTHANLRLCICRNSRLLCVPAVFNGWNSCLFPSCCLLCVSFFKVTTAKVWVCLHML